MAIPETTYGFNRHALTYVNKMVDMGVLTNAIINPLTTVAGLRAVTAPPYETDLRFYEQYQKQIDYAQAIGTLTNANVAAADTVAGLRTLFTGNDASLVATDQYSMVA